NFRISMPAIVVVLLKARYIAASGPGRAWITALPEAVSCTSCPCSVTITSAGSFELIPGVLNEHIIESGVGGIHRSLQLGRRSDHSDSAAVHDRQPIA